MDLISVKKDAYYDSVMLMLVSRDIKSRPGVEDAVVGMGTEMNISLIRDSGYSSPALDTARAGDLIVALRTGDQDTAADAMAAVEEMLSSKPSGNSAGASLGNGPLSARSLSTAFTAIPDANLVVISIPGPYAAREARKALEKGLHVMLFSDNVSLEDEISLKSYARERGLLVMGPDCGTSIINGVPLCFANAVSRGPIGIAAASGTGLQEVTCLIDRFGSGITQAIGTGSRDLKNERVGGMTMLTSIEALAEDNETQVITVISKPPAKKVEERVVDALKKTGKKAVAHFIGSSPRPLEGNIVFAENLEETARFSVAAAGVPAAGVPAAGVPAVNNAAFQPSMDYSKTAAFESAKMASSQRYLRGLYTGGTLADEALLFLHGPLKGVYSNNQTDPGYLLADPQVSQEHAIVDLGDDVFTSGAPHPMIDPAARAERLVVEAGDSETAVIIMDFVLGYGSHSDPAGAVADAIMEAKRIAESRGGFLSVVTSITGTVRDVQNMDKQHGILTRAGCVVTDSNYQATVCALEILKSGGCV